MRTFAIFSNETGGRTHRARPPRSCRADWRISWLKRSASSCAWCTSLSCRKKEIKALGATSAPGQRPRSLTCRSDPRCLWRTVRPGVYIGSCTLWTHRHSCKWWSTCHPRGSSWSSLPLWVSPPLRRSVSVPPVTFGGPFYLKWTTSQWSIEKRTVLKWCECLKSYQIPCSLQPKLKKKKTNIFVVVLFCFIYFKVSE